MTSGCAIDASWERRWGIPEWEPRDMTICIAATCEEGQTLILCSDAEIGVEFTTAELGRAKWGGLCKGWNAAIAGTVANAQEVILWAVKTAPSMPSNAMFDVRALLEKSYRKARLARAEGEFLASRGWTLQELIDHGKTKLPESTYANLDARIALFDFGADLIAAGFGDDDSAASILTVKNPGVCMDHTRLGFWCVGSGATAAQMSLFGRNYSSEISLERAVYYVIEAKISSERAAGVGERTDMYVKRKGTETIGFSTDTVREMRAACSKIKPRDFGAKYQEKLMQCGEFKQLEAATTKAKKS
jgi:hypothetical protein